MKLDLDKENTIVYNVMLKNISKNTRILKVIDEFGSFKYFMNANEKRVVFAFSCFDFDKIFNFSGEEFFKKEFPGKEYILNFCF